MALLEKVFSGDWEGAAPNAKCKQLRSTSNDLYSRSQCQPVSYLSCCLVSRPLKVTQKEKINRSKFGSPEDDIPDVVRPGALLSALLRLQIAMENDKAKLSINTNKIQRVSEIRHEAVLVMKRIAFN